jgi:hypothetical protein
VEKLKFGAILGPTVDERYVTSTSSVTFLKCAKILNVMSTSFILREISLRHDLDLGASTRKIKTRLDDGQHARPAWGALLWVDEYLPRILVLVGVVSPTGREGGQTTKRRRGRHDGFSGGGGPSLPRSVGTTPSEKRGELRGGRRSSAKNRILPPELMASCGVRVLPCQPLSKAPNTRGRSVHDSWSLVTDKRTVRVAAVPNVEPRRMLRERH